MWGLASEHLDECFREFRPHIPECKFGDCTHRVEPGCGVRAAVESGAISAERYDSYLRLREEMEDSERNGHHTPRLHRSRVSVGEPKLYSPRISTVQATMMSLLNDHAPSNTSSPPARSRATPDPSRSLSPRCGIERDVLVSPGNRVDSLTDDVDRERFDAASAALP